jgi:endonuclease YncB( thermonuclease family)
MVAMGYAEVCRGAPCQAYCEDLHRAEVKAKRDKVGMWVQGPGYESPAVFRRRMRQASE